MQGEARRRIASFVPLVTALVVAAVASRARAQQFPQVYRSEEVGPGELDFDEETFLNILSIEQPLESIQPVLAADAGWYAALGSLRSDVLWLDQDAKLRAPVTDEFAVRVEAHQGLDFDTDFVRLEAMPELRLGDHWYAGLPVFLGLDKGTIDGGLNGAWRDPAGGIDYVMLQWVRSDIVFNQRSDDFSQSEVEHPADNFELQAQGDFLGCGKTTLRVADEVPSKVDFVETQRVEEFSRISAWLLQAIDLDELQRVYFEASFELASEQSTPTGPAGAADAFEGDRDAYSARLEYQRDLAEDHARRVRVGSECVNFREDAEEPNDPLEDHTELRREAIVYGGYRSPLAESKEVDLETVVYLDYLDNARRFPNHPGKSTHDPDFQGKLSFYFRWHVAQRAEFVLTPSFELDTVGWGGGSFQLRYRL